MSGVDAAEETQKLRQELAHQKKAYEDLLEQKFVNIFHQPGSMFNIIRESYGNLLQCKMCKSKGGTVSLTHNGSCRYTGTQVWYRTSSDQVTIYDVAMFDSRRRF